MIARRPTRDQLKILPIRAVAVDLTAALTAKQNHHPTPHELRASLVSLKSTKLLNYVDCHYESCVASCFRAIKICFLNFTFEVQPVC